MKSFLSVLSLCAAFAAAGCASVDRAAVPAAGGSLGGSSQARSPEYMRAFPVYSPSPPPPGGSAQTQPMATPCPTAGPGIVGCQIVNGAAGAQGLVASTLALNLPGLKPADLQSAYNLSPLLRGGGQTIGIVVAYDNPNAASDLTIYRTKFLLPPCLQLLGCFKKIGQDGSSTLPPPDPTWAVEESIDVDMASAICPNCRIIVAEANSSLASDLVAAAQAAVNAGATVVSNSYGMLEDAPIAAFDQGYSHSVSFVAGSGDSGALEWPASSAHTIAVGGTSLKRAAGTARGWIETPWASAGSGCSAYIGPVPWQPVLPGCNGRLVADVAAFADPDPGVAVYDSYLPSGGGWRTYGGTSVATPIVAGIIALAGNGAQLTDASYIYGRRTMLNPLPPSADQCLGGLCAPSMGYSAATGLGSPNGTGAF